MKILRIQSVNGDVRSKQKIQEISHVWKMRKVKDSSDFRRILELKSDFQGFQKVRNLNFVFLVFRMARIL